MTRVVLDPRLLATGIAFERTPARQLLVLAGLGKLGLAAKTTDAALAHSVGGTLMGSPPLAVDQADVDRIAAALPAGVPTDLRLVASRPLLDACAQHLSGFFAARPPLRATVDGLRPEPLIADLVAVPRVVRRTQDQLLYCGLEAGAVIVSDNHVIAVQTGGMPTPLEDPHNDRHAMMYGLTAFVGKIGPSLRAVDGSLLKDICAMLRP